MPLVIRHYQQFCDRVTIYDNHSTDGSDKLAEQMGCRVIKFGTKFFDDAENMRVKNNCWKGSDADWVIVADFDELFWNPPWLSLIDTNSTIQRTIGWQIMSEHMPKHDMTEILTGYEFSNYAKSVCFNPKAITEINYNPGAHRCDPKGNVVWSNFTSYVLHYKHIGGVERTIRRYQQYRRRMSKANLKNGWGIHYSQTPARLRKEWEERMKISKQIIWS